MKFQTVISQVVKFKTNDITLSHTIKILSQIISVRIMDNTTEYTEGGELYKNLRVRTFINRCNNNNQQFVILLFSFWSHCLKTGGFSNNPSHKYKNVIDKCCESYFFGRLIKSFI